MSASKDTRGTPPRTITVVVNRDDATLAAPQLASRAENLRGLANIRERSGATSTEVATLRRRAAACTRVADLLIREATR